MMVHMPLHSRGFAVFTLGVCFFMLALFAPVAGQGATPTPAPSKTPGLASTATMPAPTAQSASPAPFEPFTQADLQLLTANVQRPNGLAYMNGYLYTACTGDGTVYEINSETGETRAYIWGVSNAHSLVVEESGDTLQMWVPDFGEDRLELVRRQGVVPVTTDPLQGPWGIVLEDDEHFLISSLLGNRINRVSRDGDVTLALDGLAAPAGLVLDGSILYVANNGSTRRAVEWYDMDTAGDGGPLVSGLQNPTGLQLGADGMLYIAYALGTRGIVGRVDPVACREAGGCTNDQVEVVLYTDLETPLAGLAVLPDGRLFVHTMFNPALYWVRLPGWPAAD